MLQVSALGLVLLICQGGRDVGCKPAMPNQGRLHQQCGYAAAPTASCLYRYDCCSARLVAEVVNPHTMGHRSTHRLQVVWHMLPSGPERMHAETRERL